MLLYANRTTSPGLQFRLHGQLAVPDLQVMVMMMMMVMPMMMMMMMVMPMMIMMMELIIIIIQVVDSEPRMGADFCFNIYDGKRALMVIITKQYNDDDHHIIS